MHKLTHGLFGLFILVQCPAFSQTIGTAKVPEDLLKATLLIERSESKTNTKYLPFPFGIFKKDGQDAIIQLTPPNLFVAVDQVDTLFHPAGSGVLVTLSNVNLFVTAIARVLRPS